MNRKLILNNLLCAVIQRDFSTDMSKFKSLLSAAKEVVVLSGAGISAESGIPTFKGKSGYWRGLPSTMMFSVATFRDDPGLVWEFTHYSRERVLKSNPNAGHVAIAQYEAKHAMDKKVTVLTQNVDGLHASAGSKNVIELHGSLFKTRCTKCNQVLYNTDSPICEVNIFYQPTSKKEEVLCFTALRGSGSPSAKLLYSNIAEKDLPHCNKPDCGGLLRPHILWFGEMIDPAIVEQIGAKLGQIYPVISNCKVLLVVGTSSLVYPAAAYPTVIAASGAIVAEFNVQPAPASTMFDFYFVGPAATTLPQALSE